MSKLKTLLHLVLSIALGSFLLAPKAGTAGDGRLLYARHCADCHGLSGRGDGPDAPLYDPRPSDLRSGLLTHHSTADLVRRVRTGAPLNLALDLEALRRHAADIEAVVGHLERLPGVDWPRVDRGWTLYLDRCQSCHGRAGRPPDSNRGARVPRNLGDPAFQAAVKDDDLVDAVRHGRKGMPALTPRLSIEEGRLIAAFVRLLSPGFAIYTSTCAPCHADDGRGVHSLGEAPGEELRLPTVVFDRQFFLRRSPEQLRAAVSHMLTAHRPRMPHFRHVLTERQLEQIVEYLKQDAPPKR